MHTCWSKAKAGHKTLWTDGEEHMKTHVGTDATAPAFIGSASQPTASSPFDVTNRHARRIEDLIQLILLVRPLLGQQTSHLLDALGAGLFLTHKLAVIRQTGKRRFQMPLCKAVKG